MSGTDITAVIGDLYEASSSGGNWFAFCREFFQHLGVDSGSLRVRDADGRHMNVLQPVLPWEGQYSRFQALDPVRGAALRTIPSRDWGTTVKLGTELMPNDTFMRSDFYQEFAKPLGRNHLLLGTIGDIDKTLILLFRETIPFTERDKQKLASMPLPRLDTAVRGCFGASGLMCPSRRASKASAAIGTSPDRARTWRPAPRPSRDGRLSRRTAVGLGLLQQRFDAPPYPRLG